MKRFWLLWLCLYLCCHTTQTLYGQQPATTHISDSANATAPTTASLPPVQYNREDSLKILLDSLDHMMRADPTLYTLGHLLFARLPVGKIDVDLARIIAINPYESVRLGIGLYTNDRLSRFIS